VENQETIVLRSSSLRTIRTIGLTVATVVVAASFALDAHAGAWGPVDAHVTTIEPSNMGAPAGSAALYIKVDQNVGACGSTGCCANTWLYWSPVAFSGASPVDNDRQMVNARAILSTVQLALATGKTVKLWGLDISGGYCQLTNVVLLNY
jgi:hypothetical protein